MTHTRDEESPEAVARRTRTYLRKGSPDPVPGRCGRRLAGPGATEPHKVLEPGTPWRYCMASPAKGHDACKHHGASSLAGPAHHNWRHGLYSIAFKDTPLQRGYEAFQSDAELLSVRESIRLLNARRGQLTERVAAATGESGSAWRRTEAAVLALAEAIRTGNSDAATVAVRELEAVVLRKAAAERDWQEERSISEVHRRLVDTEHRLLERGKHVVPVDQAVQHAAQIAALAVPHITAGRCKVCTPAGMRELTDFARELRALSEGAGVTEPE